MKHFWVGYYIQITLYEQNPNYNYASRQSYMNHGPRSMLIQTRLIGLQGKKEIDKKMTSTE